MKTFEQKQKALKDIEDRLDRATIAIFTSFAQKGQRGLPVADMVELRRQLRSVQAEYLVHKKNVLSKALKNSAAGINVDTYDGSLGTIFGYQDDLAVIKQLYTFAKTHQALKYFTALVGGKILEAADITQLAKLPSREVLIGQLVGMIAYPLRSLMNVLSEIEKKKQA